MTPLRTLAPLAVVLALAVTGCGKENDDSLVHESPGSSTSTSEEPTGAATEEQAPLALEGDWLLTGGTGAEGELALGQGEDVTLSFAAERLSGQGPCNRYLGPWTLEGSAIDISDVASTMKACEPAVMTLESAYLAALDDVDHAALVDGVLTLTGSASTLTFEQGR